jgi:tetratricopeptide (TPR) repeat protein
MTKIVIATAILAVVPSFGQTAAELLQKGIYTQETEGKLDEAIQIYRQIVNSAPNPREIGAQAQYRLAQALLQKGDTNGAAQEFSRLARDYSEYSGVISQLARQRPATALRFSDGRGNVYYGQEAADKIEEMKRKTQQATSAQPAASNAEFNPTSPIALNGKISQVQWMNPVAWATVETAGGTYRVRLASPNDLVHAGMTRNSLTPGMEVSITGILATDGSMTVQANTLSPQGKPVFTLPPPNQ